MMNAPSDGTIADPLRTPVLSK